MVDDSRAGATPASGSKPRLSPSLVATVALVLAGAGVAAWKVHAASEQARFANTPCGQGMGVLTDRLQHVMAVTLFVTPGSPKLDAYAAQVRETMGDVVERSHEKLTFQVVPVTGEAEQKRAKAAGLQEAAFGDGDAGVRTSYLGLAFEYGSEHASIPVLDVSSPRGTPFWIANKIRELHVRVDGVAVRFGVIAGKDEIKLSEPSLVAATGGKNQPTLASIMRQSVPFYHLDDLDLRGGDAEIDPELTGIIVTQPGADYTDKELRRIDQFLMRGNKTALVFASAVSTKPHDGSMKATLDLHGLDRLLAGYGVEVLKDEVLDVGSPASMRLAGASGTPVLFRAPSVLLAQRADGVVPEEQALDEGFAPFFRIQELPFPFVSTLQTHPERQPEAKVRVVARSSSRATATTEAPILDVRRPVAPSTAGAQRRAIAVTVEGLLRSAFRDHPGDGVTAPASAPRDSRLLVVSASQFLVNPFARAGNPEPGSPAGDQDLMAISQPYAQQYLTSTILVFKNTLDWASADDVTASCSALLVQAKPRD